MSSSSTTSATRAWQVVETHLPHLTQPQLTGLVLWVCGTILAGSACQNAVAAALSTRGNWNNVRQYLREWLYDGADRARPCRTELDVSLCFAPLLRWVLSWWRSGSLALAIDPTLKGKETTAIVISVEDLLYESEPVRRFVGLRLSGPLPDETTILNFRHLLERDNLGQGLLLDEINAHRESQGLRLREGTIVDATNTLALSSTRNRAGERDPEMHQTKRGNQWHFGMKAHIGVDADTGIVHSMRATGASSRRYGGTQSAARGRDGSVG